MHHSFPRNGGKLSIGNVELAHCYLLSYFFISVGVRYTEPLALPA